MSGLAFRAVRRQDIAVAVVIIAAILVVDVSAAMTTQVIFISGGFLRFWSRGDLGFAAASLGILLPLLPLVVLLILQRRDVVRGATGLLGRAGLNHLLQSIDAAGQDSIAQLEDLYRRRSATTGGIAWHLAASSFRIGATWSALWLLGHPMSLGDAMLIDVMAGAAHSLAFLIPGGLGAEKGGILLACSLVGVDAHFALALAVLKRGRDLALGLPALVNWLILERGYLLAKLAHARQ